MKKRARQKFSRGQVVMVRDQGTMYPVKLDRITHIGNAEESGFRWFDTLNHIEYEARMRPLTAKEAGRSKR